MIVPPLTQFGDIPIAGVFTDAGTNYWIKTATDSAVNLATAVPETIPNPTTTFIYLPGARLVLG